MVFRAISRTRDPRGDDGFALVLALSIMVVFAISGASVILFTVSNQHSASRSNGGASALSLAQAGIDNAVSQLVKAADDCKPPGISSCASTITNNAWSPLVSGTTVSYNNGTARYTGTLCDWNAPSCNTVSPVKPDYVWHITSTGTVNNSVSTGGTPLSKTMQADVRVGPNVEQTVNTEGWKYIYSKRTGTPGGCDQSFYNSANIQSSVYVAGNLCLNTPSQVSGPQNSGDPPVNLIVNGWVNLDSNTNIGTNAKPLTSVHIGQGCRHAGTPDPSPPSPYCYHVNNSYDEVYNSDTTVFNPNTKKQSDTAAPTVPAPVANFAAWWSVAEPGPVKPCEPQVVGQPVFDNDANNNATSGGSIPAVVDLTPATGTYDCWTPGGEIAWLPANTSPPASFPKGAVGTLSRQSYGQLYTQGTIFIDGSATIDASPVKSVGNAALYVSGTFLLKNSIFCAILTSNARDCDWSAWEQSSSPDIFLVVANGNGSAGGAQGQVPSGDSVEIKGSEAQGALYGTNAVEVDTTSKFQGPIVALTDVISQTGGAPFPVFRNVPFGTPGNPITSYSVTQVFNYK